MIKRRWCAWDSNLGQHDLLSYGRTPNNVQCPDCVLKFN